MVHPDAAAAAMQPAAALAPAAMVAAAEAERIKLLAAHAGMPAGAFFHPSLMMNMYGPAGFAAAMAGAPGHMGAMTAEAAAASGMVLPWAVGSQRTPSDAATQAACAASAAIAAAANSGWGGGVPFWAMDPAAAAAWAASAAAYGSYGAAAAPAGDAAASARPPVPAGVSRPKALPASAQLAGSTLNALGGMATGFAPPTQQQQQQQQQQAPEAGMVKVPAGLVMPVPVMPTMFANPTALLRSLELQRHYGTSPAFAKPGVTTISAPGGAGFKRPREDVAPAAEQMHAEPIAAAAQ